MTKGDVTVALLTAILLSCARPVRTVAPSPPATSAQDEIRSLVILVNQQRERAGCRDLKWDRAVALVAQAHADDMVRRNFIEHINPDGLSPFQRLARAGITYTRAAENIAAGQQTAAEVFQSWIQSPGHRRNIEDCALHYHGVGFTRGVRVMPYGTVVNAWAHLFVTPR